MLGAEDLGLGELLAGVCGLKEHFRKTSIKVKSRRALAPKWFISFPPLPLLSPSPSSPPLLPHSSPTPLPSSPHPPPLPLLRQSPSSPIMPSFPLPSSSPSPFPPLFPSSFPLPSLPSSPFPLPPSPPPLFFPSVSSSLPSLPPFLSQDNLFLLSQLYVLGCAVMSCPHTGKWGLLGNLEF